MHQFNASKVLLEVHCLTVHSKFESFSINIVFEFLNSWQTGCSSLGPTKQHGYRFLLEARGGPDLELELLTNLRLLTGMDYQSERQLT